MMYQKCLVWTLFYMVVLGRCIGVIATNTSPLDDEKVTKGKIYCISRKGNNLQNMSKIRFFYFQYFIYFVHLQIFPKIDHRQST